MSAVGDPVAVLPVAFHLLWHRRLATDDLTMVPLRAESLVEAAGAGSGQ